MNKSDTEGGLLSRVVRFVRNPSANWSELDGRLSGVGTPKDRVALRAAIERKRRNDFVRKREFDMLRAALRQRQERQAGQGTASGQSVLQGAGTEGGGQEKTLDKIARIEAQMSQNWLRWRTGEEIEPGGRFRIGGTPVTVPVGPVSAVTVPGHLQARPWGPAATLPIEMLHPDPSGAASTSPPSRHDGFDMAPMAVLEEAAVRFANGDDEAAEQSLRAAIAQEVDSPAGRSAWLALLDFFHAQGDVDRFEETAVEYVELFGGTLPRWPDATAGAPAAPGTSSPTVSVNPGLDACWTCPSLLDESAVTRLGQTFQDGVATRWLDWTALVSADLASAQALLDLVRRWTGLGVEFRFVGAGVLRRRLKASTPSGRRENDPLWWHLRLELLRLMHRHEEFELAALDFCVTYGVLPPDWVLPTNRFQVADALPMSDRAQAEAPVEVQPVRPVEPWPSDLDGMDVMEWPSVVSDTEFQPSMMGPVSAVAGAMGMGAPSVPALRGALQGTAAGELAHLQEALAQHATDQPFVIDCAGLVRLDFSAGGKLLQWLLSTMAKGIQVELIGVNRLVAAFFHVVGIDEAVTVRLREY